VSDAKPGYFRLVGRENSSADSELSRSGSDAGRQNTFFLLLNQAPHGVGWLEPCDQYSARSKTMNVQTVSLIVGAKDLDNFPSRGRLGDYDSVVRPVFAAFSA